MTYSLKFTAASDRGLVRDNNEDSAYAGPHLLILADGMGGHAAGEVASQLMVTHLEHLDQDPGDNDMLALLGAAADDANFSIAEHIAAHAETEGMGTTLTALMFNGKEFGVCHVGDSRGYRLRDGKLQQITKDDTYVQSLVDEGKLDPQDVSSHPQKSLILKAYTGRSVEPTLFMLDAKPGDRILLCSDGLSDPVTSSTIELVLSQGTLEEAATKLIELALRSGGPDNVTIVLAEIVDGAGTTSAVTAGALAGEAPEPTHPDSAASRAAKLTRRPQVIPPATQVSEEPVEDEQDAEEKPDKTRRRRNLNLWRIILLLLVILALVAGGGVWAKKYLDNNYYVAVGESEALTIHKGADFSLFGKELNSMYQHACLSKDNSLRLSSEDCSGDYTAFKVSDLPESERSAVANLPAGSYEEVQTQLTRLSAKALKACITAPSDKDSAANKDNAEKADTAEAKDGQANPSNQGEQGDTALKPAPGVNCREVRS
ncbi:PP2C family protein-serine/threonine phosphatase [Corynebacterium flavescens]|uniref:PP2C family protein-serine/threonine phosphatase n=1 Tax=Corynebacterium flavescens TaxID=28028 RepID=UPI0026494F7D|nr:protein phosphatase 2C domain-containing protein [Corynebacterium flavescens]MDN6098821.1 protein phosphatase 2C domain-containing protein [Corynebacterium flavescens]MDN6226971.1 protein phosphatase 2C domain-containing protein [Corynebacterium flavescens]MDN6235292.1 protein phosphatase 2C domain-containing protein [Corynebacterium flavescens]MDN6430834.1 protein phosphatase 2C domain-containing protein [Corynebacterium flavescens]MDN6474648.1 protein phosphatase 2C domain-containing prot